MCAIQNTVASHHPNVKDITGQKFGSWTVLYRSKTNGTGRNARWVCRCICGREEVVNGSQMRTGHSSCCRKCSGAKIAKAKRTHGEAGTHRDKSGASITYMRWNGMRARSASNKTLEGMRYAKRDIECCERWSNYRLFFEDMGECPSDKHTLDRINNDLGYCKDNCRWATQTEQQRNKSSNRMVEYNGSKMCVAEFAELICMRYHKCARLVRAGWTTDRIAAICAK